MATGTLNRSSATDVIAVDWSGRSKGEAEYLWLAQVQRGTLVCLENGRTRAEVTRRLVELGRDHPRTVVGLDFAFSFPEWYVQQLGCRDARSLWAKLAAEGEGILVEPAPPFWGRTTKRPEGDEPYRVTERGHPPAKSVFQIGGAGAVGTGSLRGMPHLAQLADAGFSVWPFDAPGWPRVVEIYPRQLTQTMVGDDGRQTPLIKSRHTHRLAYLKRWHPDQPEAMRERAAGSEDAFDAAVSALAMAAHVSELETLRQAEPGTPEWLEGEIWAPRPAEN